MDSPDTKSLRVGEWRVDPTFGQISREGSTTRLEARTMRLLVYLAEHAGEVVSIDDLLKHVWPGILVTSDSVYQSIASLRRSLGDDPKQPRYIATVPRLGYRMVATVSAGIDQPASPTASDHPGVSHGPIPATAGAPRSASHSGVRLALAAGAALCLALIGALVSRADRRNANAAADKAVAIVPKRSIGVLPFLDLTDAMDEEPFADGMTEELINRLSKVGGIQVPAPTSSFYFKGKQLPVAVVAESLGVSFILDGSVRKSGTRLRVAARLVRAIDGFVAWSETYDRPFDDMLMVQDDIAGAVTKALLASSELRPRKE